MKPKYATDFSHFDYVNPAALRGGDVRLAAIGTYDNFNRFATRGVPGERTMELYDTLFTNSDDEPGSYYPLIAESARFPADMSWMGWISTLAPASGRQPDHRRRRGLHLQ